LHVKWLDRARRDLINAYTFILKDSPQGALGFLAAVESGVAHLSRFPSLGRPGRVPGTRELVISGTPYIVPYRVRGDLVEVLRVYHASRKWPEYF